MGARASTRHLETLLGGNSTAGTLNRTLPLLPTAGNVLVARCFAGRGAGSITCPGFVTVVELTLAGTATILKRVVQAGDGQTYTFTSATGAGKELAVDLVEVVGIDGTTDIPGGTAQAAHVTSVSANLGMTAGANELVLAMLGTVP